MALLVVLAVKAVAIRTPVAANQVQAAAPVAETPRATQAIPVAAAVSLAILVELAAPVVLMATVMRMAPAALEDPAARVLVMENLAGRRSRALEAALVMGAVTAGKQVIASQAHQTVPMVCPEKVAARVACLAMKVALVTVKVTDKVAPVAMMSFPAH